MPGGIHPPAHVIANWPEPNYATPQTRPAVAVPLAITLNIVLILVSGIRFWTRCKVSNSAGWDDLLFAFAVPAIFALTIATPISTDVYDFNKHVWDVEPRVFVTQRKYVLVLMTLFSFASSMLKISILLFYRRLSQRLVSPIFKVALWMTIGSACITGFVWSLKPVFACQPISAFWDQLDYVKIVKGYKYKCFDEGADVVSASAISAVQDVLTALLPNLLLWKLQIAVKQKVMLVSLFSLAYCAAALGFVRLVSNYRVYYTSYDVTWDAWSSWLLTMLELHLAAICASAPAIKAFCAHYEIMGRMWQIPARFEREQGRPKLVDSTITSSQSWSVITEPTRARDPEKGLSLNLQSEHWASETALAGVQRAYHVKASSKN